MSDIVRQTLPARRGKAVPVNAGESIRIINTHGTQVVDFWAYVAGHMNEFIGVEQCRATWTRLYPKTGDALYSNRRRAIMTLVEDTSPGRHDTLMAPCDNERYGLLGCTTYHDNCTDNLYAGMRELGLTPPECPQPLNLFMNIPWDEEGNLEFAPALSKPGDYVTIRAEVDCIAVMSACPQDILKINSQKPVEARYEILSA